MTSIFLILLYDLFICIRPSNKPKYFCQFLPSVVYFI